MNAPLKVGAPDGAFTVDLDVPRCALAVAAHPDDVEFGCGGTLARWAAAGCEIVHLVCTDGAKGTWDPTATPADLVESRQVEQRVAHAALGGRGAVVFCGWTDGELASGLRERWLVAWWLRRLRPEVVLSHDPWRRHRLHPDHHHAGRIAAEAIVAARDPHFFPDQGLAPHRPDTLLLWEAERPDHYEQVATAFEAKVAGLMAHRSQWESTHHVSALADGSPDPDDLARFRARVEDQLVTQGAAVGLGMAEVYTRIDRL